MENIAILVLLGIVWWMERRFQKARKGLTDHLTRVQVELMDQRAMQRDYAGNQNELIRNVDHIKKLLDQTAAVDVGSYRDVGWLILCCRVQGQDRVRIQHLRQDMSPKDYKDLIERLSYDCQHVAYIDAPPHYEQFLLSEEKMRKKNQWPR